MRAALLRSKRNRGRLALLTALHLVAELLALVQIAHSRPFDGRNVHEHVLRAIVGLDEAVALLGVEPLYGSSSHCEPFKERTMRRPQSSVGQTSVRNCKQIRCSIRARKWHAEPRSGTAHTWVGSAADTRNVVGGRRA